MELKDYTTEQLKAELKRRATEERRLRSTGRSHKAEYAYAIALITQVSDDVYSQRLFYGKVLTFDEKESINPRWMRESLFMIVRANFKKDTAPKVNDIVRVKSRKTRICPNGFGNCFTTPYIIEVIGHDND